MTEPLRDSFVPAKQEAKRHYGSHPYFTKRAWNVVQEYIRHFSAVGDIVLDPFGGSGVTAVESLVLRRRALYTDISGWACFLARQTAIAPVNLQAIRDGFTQVERQCRSFIEALWRTPNGELADLEVRDWYPRGVALPGSADVQRVEDLHTPRMLHGLARLRASILEVADRQVRELLLFAFSATLARMNRTFLSTTNRRESRGGSAIFSIYRYKIAKRVVELPLWDQFAKRVDRMIEAKSETNQLIGDFYAEGTTASFRHLSATRLTEWLGPESVDYIYTDPPYGGNIAYLDLSTMWAAWLGLDVTARDRVEEVIEGGGLDKSVEVYHHLMCSAVQQMFEVLRSGAWMSIVFAHRDTSYWERIVEACTSQGFRYVNTVVQPVGVVWSMHKKKNPLRVLSGELVLNFRKGGTGGRPSPPKRRVSSATAVRRCSQRLIIARVGATTDELHAAIVPMLLETGALRDFSQEHGDITPLLREHFSFDEATGRWFLRNGDEVPGRIPRKDLLRYYTVLFLSARETGRRPPTEREIGKHLCSLVKNGDRVGSRELREILEAVGYSPDDRHWVLAARHGQQEFAFP